MIATGARSIIKHKTELLEISRHNPWFVLFHKRSMTPEEADARLSEPFFKLYGGFARMGQWIGVIIVTAGIVGFVVSLFKKFLL